MNSNTPVILNPISTNRYRSISEEPQYVQIRSTNTAFLYLDAQSSRLETDKTNMILSSVKTINDQPSKLTNSICRLEITDFGVFYVTPNVNPTNNQLTFFSSNTSATYTVTIPMNFYGPTSSPSLMDVIVTALNTVSGASGITFNQTPVSYSPVMYNLNAVGGLFYILPTCNAVTNGMQLYNFPIMPPVPVATTIVGNMGFYYTRWIDICSNRLNAYSKHPSLSNSGAFNIAYRAFIDDPTRPHWFAAPLPNNISISFEPTDSLSQIDFQLRDQFGNFLYLPPGPNGAGFLWDLDIILEI